MEKNVPGDDVQTGADGFRRSTPEDRAMRKRSPADQRKASYKIRVGRSATPMTEGVRSPFSIHPGHRSPVMSTVSMGPGTGESRASRRNSPTEQLDIMSPTGGRNKVIRRSTLQPPPIGERSQAWGRYDTLQEILMRPQPPPAVEQGQFKTMSMHGGRWSYHQPVNQLYVLSRISHQTPGPGQYVNADPAVSGKSAPFGKMTGGRLSKSPLRAHSYDMCYVGKTVPGPGAYDTDHLFGMYGRIRAAIPKSNTETTRVRSPLEDYGEDWSDSDSSRDGMENTATGVGYFDDMDITTYDPIFDEKDITAVEQRLVMSKRVPSEKFRRLGTTRFSRLRKDAHAPKVRKIQRFNPEMRSSSSLSFFEHPTQRPPL